MVLTCDREVEEPELSPHIQTSEEPTEVFSTLFARNFIELCDGITSARTLKLVLLMVVMVGPRATHNFNSKKTVKSLEIPVTPSIELGVPLGTGDLVQEGRNMQVSSFKVQEIVMVEIVFIIRFREPGYNSPYSGLGEVGNNDHQPENTNITQVTRTQVGGRTRVRTYRSGS